jgi:TniQ
MRQAIRVPRRMAAVPEPFADESFGSWLARLADAHFTTRAELARALLAESGESGVKVDEIDYNSQPPVGFIEALSKRTGRTRSDLEDMLVPTALAILPCGTGESGPYCPSCWREDHARGSRYIRRQWCERWTVLCEVHEIPLRASRLSVERLLCAGLHDPAWLGETRISMWPAQLRAGLLRAQRVIRAHALHGPIPADAADRVRVLTDLSLLVGTAFGGASLIDQSVDLEGDASPKLSRRDAPSAAFCSADVYERRGTLEVRQRALRLAVVILHRFVDAAISARAEDVAILATLNLLQPGSQLASECDRMVRSWPAQYRASWELAFGWPGQGGAGYFTRRYGPLSLSSALPK